MLGNVNSTYFGVTIPPQGIFVGKGVFIKDQSMIWHEFGHILQFQKHGPFAYYRVIAPESLIDALVTDEYGHLICWTETYANYLARNYMYNKYPQMRWSNHYPAKNISWFNKLKLDIASCINF